jgi:hypothetical protein
MLQSWVLRYLAEELNLALVVSASGKLLTLDIPQQFRLEPEDSRSAFRTCQV